MLACLRSAQFMYPDRSASVVVELRRHHDTDAQGAKEFLVTRRFTMLPKVLIKKSFGTYREAARHWDEQVAVLADTGMERRDAKIIGFREEG